MQTQTNNKLMALANTLGKPIAFVLRKQLGIVNWLVAKGWSKGLAKLMLKILNIFILTVALFIFFPTWTVLIAMVGGLVIISGVDSDVLLTVQDRPIQEWRDGMDGYGLYDNLLGIRIDGGSSNNENDPTC